MGEIKRFVEDVEVLCDDTKELVRCFKEVLKQSTDDGFKTYYESIILGAEGSIKRVKGYL